MKDLTGCVFGKLKVEGFHGVVNKSYKWIAKCECGKTKLVNAGDLVSGRTNSCGCIKSNMLKAKNTTHGKTGHYCYSGWRGMIQRCTDANHKQWKDYGGRGIKVCERWQNSFANFLEDMGERPDGMELDRINNDGDYEPGNCRWISRNRNSKNKRSNVLITWNGETKCATEWDESLGLAKGVVGHRLKKGWSVEKAITTPSNKVKNANA